VSVSLRRSRWWKIKIIRPNGPWFLSAAQPLFIVGAREDCRESGRGGDERGGDERGDEEPGGRGTPAQNYHQPSSEGTFRVFERETASKSPVDEG
jgi:hypothetical protein